ncbi:MAG TPA: hypothetical protein VGG25_20770 [Streptosporangiaceae bacterium]|jgi:hypothetical protein
MAARHPGHDSSRLDSMFGEVRDAEGEDIGRGRHLVLDVTWG